MSMAHTHITCHKRIGAHRLRKRDYTHKFWYAPLCPARKTMLETVNLRDHQLIDCQPWCHRWSRRKRPSTRARMWNSNSRTGRTCCYARSWGSLDHQLFPKGRKQIRTTPGRGRRRGGRTHRIICSIWRKCGDVRWRRRTLNDLKRHRSEDTLTSKGLCDGSGGCLGP